MFQILLSLLLNTYNIKLETERMFVQSIANGNTINMVAKGQNYQVRLCGIDVPAAQQNKAKILLQKLIQVADEQEKPLVVVVVNQHNKNIIAEVFAPTTNPDEEKFLNAELLAAGLGNLTNESCPNRDALVELEQEAKQGRMGMWRQRR